VATDFIATEFADGVGLRWQSQALLALQEAAEAFLVHLFEDAYHNRHPDPTITVGTCVPFMPSA
jgi:histone H3/H4